MVFLLFFSFISGIVTILSPCILPVLPIILSGSIGGNSKKPFGIVIGFILSFSFFTLSLASLVKLINFPSDVLRNISVAVIIFFGLSLLIPKIQLLIELLFSKVTSSLPKQRFGENFWGGIFLGISLGLVWTPCVGPIMASVIALAASSQINLVTILVTLAYSIGTAVPMLAVIFGGRKVLQKIPYLQANSIKIQKFFGVVMIVTAIGLYFNIDRDFQTFVLRLFPQYGSGLTNIENNNLVFDQLKQLQGNQQSLKSPSQTSGQQYPIAPELIAGGVWFNSKPLTLASLKGKVVLIDFWTYTCINCIRTLPYLRAWHDKYVNQGLVIIGVHTPEFEFEKSEGNVQKAISDFGIKYPVMQDNNYATWNAYSNNYWPAEYLIDAQGKLRHTHFGEGEYDQTEQAIQELLRELGVQVDKSLANVEEQTPSTVLSPETYLGSKRMQYFYPFGNTGNANRNFTLADTIPQDSFSLGGNWVITDENAQSGQNSVLSYNFYADKVFLVLRPGPNSSDNKIKVFLDGHPVDNASAGADVQNGIVNVDKDKLYNLIDLRGKSENHLLRLEFQGSGIQVFAFTFG